MANDFRGSLYSKVIGILNIYDEIHIYKPEEENPVLVNYVAEKKKTTSLYNIENLKKDDKYTFFTNGNHAEINIKTTASIVKFSRWIYRRRFVDTGKVSEQDWDMTIIRQQLRKKIIISIFNIKTEIFPENLLISAQFLLPHNKQATY